MKRSTSFAQFSFALFTFLVLSFSATATVPTHGQPLGGPRQIIQFRTANVEVNQTAPEVLYITVVDEDGVVVHNYTTCDASSTFSTDGWEPGEYTVQTVDNSSDYQEHIIVVE